MKELEDLEHSSWEAFALFPFSVLDFWLLVFVHVFIWVCVGVCSCIYASVCLLPMSVSVSACLAESPCMRVFLYLRLCLCQFVSLRL